MRLKHIVKPVLIDFLRYMDKNNVLKPFRIRYSSFRSKKNMVEDLTKYYDITECVDYYTFTLKPQYRFLVAPHYYYFSKTAFVFLETPDAPQLDLDSRPEPPRFHVRHGRFLVKI